MVRDGPTTIISQGQGRAARLVSGAGPVILQPLFNSGRVAFATVFRVITNSRTLASHAQGRLVLTLQRVRRWSSPVTKGQVQKDGQHRSLALGVVKDGGPAITVVVRLGVTSTALLTKRRSGGHATASGVGLCGLSDGVLQRSASQQQQAGLRYVCCGVAHRTGLL